MVDYNTQVVQDPSADLTDEQIGHNIEQDLKAQDASRTVDEQGVSYSKNVPGIGLKFGDTQIQDNAHNDAVQSALADGYSKEEIAQYLESSKGLKPEDASFSVVDAVSQSIKKAQQDGYSEEDIRKHLEGKSYDPSVIDQAIKISGAKDAWKQYEVKQTQALDEANTIKNLYSNIYSKYSTTGNRVLAAFDNPEAANQANQDISDLNTGIVNKLKEYNIKSEITSDGQIIKVNDDGSKQLLDSSSIANSKQELTLGIVGALGGAEAGAAAGTAVLPGIGTTVGGVVGGIAGGMTGAAAGRGLDLLVNAAKLKENLSTKMYLSQMGQAGIYDGIVGVLGSAVTATAGRAVMGAYKYYLGGNVAGATKALLDSLNITKDQAATITKNWENSLSKTPMTATRERLNKVSLGLIPKGTREMTPNEKTITAIASTQLGAEKKVAEAAGQSLRVETLVKQDISKRAKSLHAAINEVNNENTGKLVRNELVQYQNDVKEFYAAVKKQGTDAIDGTDFNFNLRELAIDPIMKSIETRVPAIKLEQFKNYLERINNLAQVNTFSGMIDLRQAINEFKYSKIINGADMEAINKVINGIDTKIAKAAKEYIPDHKVWTENFKVAKAEYNQMKQLEENVLFKTITSLDNAGNADVTEKTIRSAVSKYANGTDLDAEIYNNVLERLSQHMRSKVEVSTIKSLADNLEFTIGKETDLQAVHFPLLAEKLNRLNISTPEAKGLVKVVNEIAKVFKNDHELSGITAGTKLNETQSAMSANLIQKAKYTAMNKLWHIIVRILPTESSRNISLVNNLGRLLENPLHVKTAEDLLQKIPLPARSEMTSLVKDLQIQVAKQNAQQQTKQATETLVDMYHKSTKSGNLSVTSGSLGKGVYVFNKIANRNPEMNIVKQRINTARMATLDDISNLVGRDVTEGEIRTIPNLEKQLKDKKFLGIQLQDKAMLFADSVIKSKKGR